MPSDLSHPIFALSSDLVDNLVALYPDAATYLGVPGFDDRWPDLSPDGADAIVDGLNDMQRRLDDLPGGGTHFDRLAVSVARSAIEEELALYSHDDHLRDLNSIASPIQGFREVFDHMAKDSVKAWGNIIARLDSLPRAMHKYRMSLELGLEKNMAVAERQVLAAAEQSSAHAGSDSAPRRPGACVCGVRRWHLARGPIDKAIDQARRAYGEFADWLGDSYLSKAVQRNAVGRERYVRAAHRFLGTDIDPEETYAWGWSEVAALKARMEAARRRNKAGRLARRGAARPEDGPEATRRR